MGVFDDVLILGIVVGHHVYLTPLLRGGRILRPLAGQLRRLDQRTVMHPNS